ncbi:MAG TPA: hypothetical protein DDW90_06115 [Cyanobacteria bacterium UBA9971]|nr:hypothetical protein [Cyanobacteria bacterium UBA9971]
MKNILSQLLNFFKSPTSLMFLFLTILLGTLLFFMHNNHLQKTKINSKFSKNTGYNNSSKLSFAKTKSSGVKYILDNYSATGKTTNLNKFIAKNLYSENFAAPLTSEKYNPKNTESTIAKGNLLFDYTTDPVATGYAVPINQSLNIFFPPPFVVVTHSTTTPPSPPPPPPPVPIPEPSSMILGLIGLSGILGFAKKRLFKQLRSCLVKVSFWNCH